MRAKNKFPIKAELAEKILAMNPADLTNEIARYQINIEAEKENIAKDPQTIKLQDEYNTIYEEVVEADETVKQKKAELEQAKDEATTEKVLEAKQNLSAWKRGMGATLREDKKVLKFMLKTFKSHLESGVIKLKD